jgi:glucosyltransferase
MNAMQESPTPDECTQEKSMLTVIVPCFNEQESVPLFYAETTKVLDGIGCVYELLFVNDGSTDGTLRELRAISQKDPRVLYLSFSRHFGKEAAMYAGFANAGGDYVAVMDVDLQDPPGLLPRMLEIVSSGEYDCVATKRENRKGEPVVRSWFARRFYQLVSHISDASMVDGERDYRLMKRDMVDAILAMGEYNRFSKGIFGWIGFRTYWLSYENVERAAGKTKWSFWGLCKYAFDGIINFSQAPLDMVAVLGIVMTGISLILLIVIVLRRLIFGDPVAGWASTICVIIFIGGLLLFCQGVIAQYVSKMYLESKHRPHFIVSETNKPDATKLR